jgi:hypothetical protein
MSDLGRIRETNQIKYDIPADHISRGLKMVLATEILFAIACTLTKLSMLLLVRRILASASLFWRRITLFAIWIVALQGTIFCFTALFQCRPISAAWEVTVDKNPNCINDDVSLLVAGIINTLTDFVVVLLPIRAVWNLQLPSHHPQSIASDLRMKSLLPSRQTVPLVILFALGFLSCVAGALRTYYTWQISKTWDKIWASYPVWVWAALELYIGIVSSRLNFLENPGRRLIRSTRFVLQSQPQNQHSHTTSLPSSVPLHHPHKLSPIKNTRDTLPHTVALHAPNP